MQSFHLSLAVNNAARRPEYRCLVIYHFITAFAKLSGVSQLYEDAEEIRQLCTRKWYITTLVNHSFSQRNGPKFTSWDAPIRLIKTLERRCGGLQGKYPIMLDKHSEQEVLRREAKIFLTMYGWLEHLAGQSFTFGALGIAKAVLF